MAPGVRSERLYDVSGYHVRTRSERKMAVSQGFEGISRHAGGSGVVTKRQSLGAYVYLSGTERIRYGYWGVDLRQKST